MLRRTAVLDLRMDSMHPRASARETVSLRIFAPAIGGSMAWCLALMIFTQASIAADRSPAPADAVSTQSLILNADRFSDALALHRGRVILVHFWATWCTPCRRELPSLVAFHQGPYRELAREGLTLLMVNNDVRRKDLDRFLEKSSLPFPIYFDSLNRLGGQFGLLGLPGTVVIGRNGEVTTQLYGPQDWQSDELLALLSKYTNE